MKDEEREEVEGDQEEKIIWGEEKEEEGEIDLEGEGGEGRGEEGVSGEEMREALVDPAKIEEEEEARIGEE